MSPVSRKRKPKNKNKNTSAKQREYPRSALDVLTERLGDPRAHAWFEVGTKSVLDQADTLLAARGPRELEQATAELLGAELYRATYEEASGRFEGWFTQLVNAAADAVRDTGEGPLRLLYGIASVGTRPVRAHALGKINKTLKHVKVDRPDWLALMPDIKASGQLWEMRDIYATRIALIAEFAYPGGVDPSVFLFDIDAHEGVRFAECGVYDDLAAATSAWRAQVGEPAEGAEAKPVHSADQLQPLQQPPSADLGVRGDESRIELDNWLRAPRRAADVAVARGKAGMPRTMNLFREVDIEPVVAAFVDWHDGPVDVEVVEALAEEWMEGMLPDTLHSVSPERLRTIKELVGDWLDDPITDGVKALLPAWVQWHGERAGLPAHLVDRAVAAVRE